MSWFDTKGFATLAKTALKEAQKKIDQVLDIQDDSISESPAISKNTDSTFGNEEDCNLIKETFLSNIKENQMITTPPKASKIDEEIIGISTLDNVQSNDTSLDLPPPKALLPGNIGLSSPTYDISSAISSVIGMDANDDKIYSEYTVAGEGEEDITPRESAVVGSNSSINRIQTLIEKSACEQHAVDSDSTHSFEDIQRVHSPNGSMDNRPSTISPLHSNDELETTTSSDIEIISNPNGEGSSSANSHIAPQCPIEASTKGSELSHIGPASSSNVLEKGCKGHCREPSEVSILSVDFQSEDELEKLINRMTELNSTIETLELRLLESTRQNCALQERNTKLQVLLDASKQQSPEEYMKRLSSLEKKYQASKQESETFRSKIIELQDKVPKSDLTQALNESQNVIAELKQEGEKLSKEILQQSNIIKKLRSKEKSSDVQLKTYKEQLTTATDEIERLKKSLSAREDIERSQIDAVHRLSSENQKMEKERAQLSSKLEDTTQKLNTLQHSFNAVKNELQQRSKQHSDFKRTAEVVQTMEKEKVAIQTENQELQRQLQELRENLRLCEQAAMQREQRLRDENRLLISRCEIAEMRVESTTQEVSQTTIPLMRQLESLQHTLNQRTTNWNKEEKILLEKLDTCQNRLHALEDVEASVKEQNDILKSRCVELEGKLAQAIIQDENTKINLRLEYKQTEHQHNKEMAAINKKLEIAEAKVQSLTKTQKELHQKLEYTEEELKKVQECLQREQNANCELMEYSRRQETQSPAASGGANSFEDAMGACIDWQQVDLECVSNSGRPFNIPGIGLANLTNNAGTLEHLQSLLKQKDGEILQCQWEISRLQAERNLLQEEMSQLTLELEKITEKLQNYETIQSNHNDLQTRYDALLQMYGEKVERTEELELDLKECKEAYKTQIQELLMKLKT